MLSHRCPSSLDTSQASDSPRSGQPLNPISTYKTKLSELPRISSCSTCKNFHHTCDDSTLYYFYCILQLLMRAVLYILRHMSTDQWRFVLTMIAALSGTNLRPILPVLAQVNSSHSKVELANCARCESPCVLYYCKGLIASPYTVSALSLGNMGVKSLSALH